MWTYIPKGMVTAGSIRIDPVGVHISGIDVALCSSTNAASAGAAEILV
jgi:hypothetical protein